jgi:hypothetical protein
LGKLLAGRCFAAAQRINANSSSLSSRRLGRLGITRLNVYAGMAGLYFVRNSLAKPDLPRIPFPPAGANPALATSTELRELPIAMQDRRVAGRADARAATWLPG